MAVVVEDAAAVLGFWFGEVPPDKRFAKDPVLDRVIEERFGALREAVLASDADGWRDSPDRLLAAIILLDQFSRNIFRGSGRAFAADPLARSLTLQAFDRGWEDRYAHEQLRFLYLPLAHAEDIEMQALSVARYEALGDPEALRAAREHAEVVRLYGRFPSRNAALARPSTPAEISYLRETTHRW
ncbi:hypothetical protein BK022_04460 [Methylorubrum extorquens]|jgi:uncharacterized protein (DUF924 family)|uniref:DUF924 domain-containing protein n=1 Tax=Methylorubrum extorquens TaxID=408 RepID=A0A1S1PAI2_METEX|nr:hypothetical protein BK022_04460 [Methylorubrum extorquens]